MANVPDNENTGSFFNLYAQLSVWTIRNLIAFTEYILACYNRTGSTISRAFSLSTRDQSYSNPQVNHFLPSAFHSLNRNHMQNLVVSSAQLAILLVSLKTCWLGLFRHLGAWAEFQSYLPSSEPAHFQHHKSLQ
jgi:hypothetical protein